MTIVLCKRGDDDPDAGRENGQHPMVKAMTGITIR